MRESENQEVVSVSLVDYVIGKSVASAFSDSRANEHPGVRMVFDFPHLHPDGGTNLFTQSNPRRFVVNEGIVELASGKLENLDFYTSKPNAWLSDTALSFPLR
jgi:hypothetical protein